MDEEDKYVLEILRDMDNVRKYCQMINRIRSRRGLAVSYPLQEVQINSIETGILMSELRQLIADEVNVDHVEPFILDNNEGDWEVEKEEEFTVVLNMTKSDAQQARYEARREKRNAAQARKDAGEKPSK